MTAITPAATAARRRSVSTLPHRPRFVRRRHAALYVPPRSAIRTIQGKTRCPRIWSPTSPSLIPSATRRTAQVPAVIAQYGGRFLVRAGAIHPREGDLGLDRFVIIEFPSLDVAQRFYDSPEYAPLLKLRMETTRSHVALVEGAAPPA